MESCRDKFHEFLGDKGLSPMLNVTSVQTIENDPKLRYNRIEQFRFSMLSWSDLGIMMEYCKKNGIEMYLAFNHLFVGYPDAHLHTRLEVFQ